MLLHVRNYKYKDPVLSSSSSPPKKKMLGTEHIIYTEFSVDFCPNVGGITGAKDTHYY